MTIAYHSFLGLVFLSLYFIHSASTSNVYIVYLGLNNIQDPILTSNYHLQLLSNVFPSQQDARKSMLYSYKHSFSGFSAKLNSTQAETLAGIERVVSVFKSRILRLHTTRSWDFMGLNLNLDPIGDQKTPIQLTHGDNTIVGLFDTGIWPESKSFHEEPNMQPIPKTWRGKCVKGQDFDPKTSCNLKLIGARYYLKGYEEEHGLVNTTGSSEYRSPRDANGHGTHTASTAVGSTVKKTSFLGFGIGTARGGAPRVRLAVYKVCWGDGRCSEADILAAFDEAINDGVDVISASFGLPTPLVPFYISSSDIGSFHAMHKGISVIFSAGNSGPAPSLVQNVAPWSTCVGASSIDRNFPTKILLDNSLSFTGESLNTEHIEATLIGARTYFRGGICRMSRWRNNNATGAVILCFSAPGAVQIEEAEVAAWAANATGLIFVDSPTRQYVDVDIIPTIRVDMIQGTKMYHYISMKSSPKVHVFPSKTLIKQSPAPIVAEFSSRGPSSISPDILKPDITAPGISILAAWPPVIPPTSTTIDQRSVEWNFQSGTSMSSPHVSGIVALIKSLHPDWSPAAIRSALITTAYNRDTNHDTILSAGTNEDSNPFDIGAGHINPLKAIDPGLVYDLKPDDYVLFLCNNGYTEDQIKRIIGIASGVNVNCEKEHKSNTNLNYPSITVSSLESTITVKRTVRNVGGRKSSVYIARIVCPHGVEVTVWPRILFFSYLRDEISYFVSFKPEKVSQGRYDYGEIVWSDGFHTVRSPLVVCVNTTTSATTIDESSQAFDQSLSLVGGSAASG